MFIVEWEAGCSLWNRRLDVHSGMGGWMFIVEWEAGWS
jgi:hypothetical protein